MHTQAFTQLLNVFDSMLVDLFLHHRPDSVVYWTQLGLLGAHRAGGMKSGVSAFSKWTVSRTRCNVKSYVTLTQYLQGKGRTIKGILEQMCVTLSDRQTVIFALK